VVREEEVGMEPARKMVKRDDKGAAGESNERAIPEGGTVDSQATTDEETVKAQFKISPVKAGGAEAGVQRKPARKPLLKKQGGPEGEHLEEKEREPMEGLEEERPAEMEGLKEKKPAGSQRVEEQERGEKERVRKEKRTRKRRTRRIKRVRKKK
jgi:hypothetical protein